jgi:tRNA G10  N-methylase Trm11
MLDLIQELETLYLAAFKTLASLIKPGGRLVFVFPLFKTVNGIFSLKILEQLEKMGFSRSNPFPETVSLFAKIGPTARGSLIYSRPDQKVEREIFVFKYIQ